LVKIRRPEMSGIRVMGNKGFHITFENGVTVSAQIGYGYYCNIYPHHPIMSIGTEIEKKIMESPDCEVAAWIEGEKEFITQEFFHGEDGVRRWVNPEELLEFLNWAKNYEVKNA
jgi:hypothetical protein